MIQRRIICGWLCFCLCGMLAWSPEPARAAQAAAPDPQVLYDCETKAAEYTKNLGKPGDKTLYQEHLKLCLEVSGPKQLAKVGAAGGASCAAGTIPLKFVNKSGERIWIGAWGTPRPVAPANWPKWKLEPNASGVWCAPKNFSGRLAVRASCDEATGICLEGNCCADGCPDFNCQSGTKPASVVEFTFNDKNEVWYDASYVDGYNFSVQIERSPGKVINGNLSLPDCPWAMVNNVCLAPYFQYAVENPWHEYEQDYLVLAAACAKSTADDPKKKMCGCGNTCPEAEFEKCLNQYVLTHPADKSTVTLRSSGCSPISDYSAFKDAAANPAKQVVCDPLKPKRAGDDCLEWPEKYKVYVSELARVSPTAYSWQYNDGTGLAKAPVTADLAFTITVGGRAASSKGHLRGVEIAPDKHLASVMLTNGQAAPVQIAGIGNMTVALQDGAKLVIDRQCAKPDTHLSCEVSLSGGKLSVSDSKENCRNSNANLAFPKPGLIAMGMPDASACVNKDSKLSTFNIYAGADVMGVVYVDKQSPRNLVGGKDFSMDLQDAAAVTTVLKCDQGKTLTCTSKFNAKTGFLEPDPGQDDCWTMGWKNKTLELHPARPAVSQCK